MRLYIVRHADPDYENQTITELGHREAKALGERMERVRIDKVYSSPLGRAVDTARYTAERKGLEIEKLDWAAEIDWYVEHERYEKLIGAYNVDGDVIRTLEPEPKASDWMKKGMFANEKFAREFEVIRKGSDELLAGHGYVRDGGVYRFEKSNDEAIAVFCHGGLGLVWLGHLLQLPMPQFWAAFFLRPTSVTTILMDERTEGVATPRCLSLADESHLVMSGLENERVPGGIVANYE